MGDIQSEDKIKRKPANPTPECMEMLAAALDYIEESSPKQADIMFGQFLQVMQLLEIMPGIGTKYKKGMRKIKLGKFRYNIYYREKESEIEVVGIWHTSRGTDFEEPD